MPGIIVSRKVTIRKFRNERRRGTENLKKDLFLGHLQPPLDKNSKHLAILNLGFDEATEDHLYRL